MINIVSVVQELGELNRQRSLTPDARLRAIVVYCEGVSADFPQTSPWMENIIAIAEGKFE